MPWRSSARGPPVDAGTRKRWPRARRCDEEEEERRGGAETVETVISGSNIANIKEGYSH